MMTILYDILLVVLAIALSIKTVYQLIFYKKYRQSLLQRFGIGFPKIQKGNRKLIWIHAVSLGETKAIAPLVKKFKTEGANALLVISTVTETGYAEAKKNIPEADFHVYLPFDSKWIIRPIVQRVKPDVVILCETDFWYNFLSSSKEVGASIVLANGKLSEKSLRYHQLFPWFSKSLFNLIDIFCLQSNHYKDRFLKLGIPKEKIEVTGNMKMDGHYPRLSTNELEEWKKKFCLGRGDLLLVAGSTHDPEEKMLLDIFQQAWKKIPGLFLLLVPRHPERFQEVSKLLEQRNIPFQRYSQLEASPNQGRLILMDQMGLLRQCYQLADIAFVGGSYTPKVGGHNIMEPAWYGIPVLFGPYMHSQLEMVALISQYKAGLQVDFENLSHTLMDLFTNVDERQALGEAGSKMAQELTGATLKTFHTIRPFLSL
ncbi:MAG TPA: 3-deoxy-D-manno-octulosonic acid transferase [Waddliaceae bacterium]